MKVQTAVVFAVVLCAQSGFGQNRPIIPEVFQSRVSIEVTTGAGVSRGVGKVIFDQPAGKASEVYAIRPGPRDEFVTRYDLGAIFHNDPPSCDVTDVTGTMPLTWGWVQNAKQDNAEVIDGITVDFWVFTKSDPDPDPDLKPFSFGTGTLRVGVTPDDSNTPVFYEVITPERTVRLHFSEFQDGLQGQAESVQSAPPVLPVSVPWRLPGDPLLADRRPS